MKVNLKVWRQKDSDQKGHFENYTIDNVSPDSSFLEMFDILNEKLVSEGKIVNFYPEHALWPRYEKLRPFKPGAFRYAVKFNVPILPLFIEFRQTRLRRLLHRKKKVIVHILPAVYPSAEGTERERSQRLAAAVFEAMRQEGNRLYGRETSARAAVPEELAPQSMSAAPAKDPGKGPAAALFSSAQESEPQPENG